MAKAQDPKRTIIVELETSLIGDLESYARRINWTRDGVVREALIGYVRPCRILQEQLSTMPPVRSDKGKRHAHPEKRRAS
jgi:hypothetical protein